MIKQKEYAKRRLQLMDIAGEGSVIIVRAAAEKMRNKDTAYPYRQDSDFLYLSGFSEPGAMMVLIPQQKGGCSTMFCRERDKQRELWDGERAGTEGVGARYGFDEAFPITEMKERLPEMQRG